MCTLIVPDLHNHTENAEHWLTTQKFDRVVFLGDYFDEFGDDVSDARKTALWLRNRIDSTDDIFLLGNHDAAYLFPDIDELYCPGFTKVKAQGIREILTPKHWLRFKLAHEEQGWLLSHAGFHPVWIENPSVERILKRCETAMDLAKRRKADPILGYGEKPGGIQRFGGPLWMTWENFIPIPGINQIVGHTSGEEFREKLGTDSRNYCVDVGCAAVAAIVKESNVTMLHFKD